MRIIVESEDERIAVETLFADIYYQWDSNAEDAFPKAFEYVNDRKECWDEEGELIKDYEHVLRNVLRNIGKTKIDVEIQQKYKVLALDTDFHEFITIASGLSLDEANTMNNKYKSGTMIEIDN
jgi:hypothetical protein